ncbi:putative disease resistance RPP13-like protein 3 [Brachypodium distachyon]|uniref:putative disease resistance RPP13-like protein 3 n=1 Tax=Brachypodium distachyon TaxID=15368 RepID=UPI000D0DA013|nr:putative disease resistance RPP13-like protein 3 [Brachypodium distachyon]|eukprot:XP_024310290.1 putative disease resistance RPP13-like protein 3 [Brachypodium distachyon]
MEVLASVVGAVVSTTVKKLLTVIGKESGNLKLDAEFIQWELSLIYATVRDQPPDSTRSSNIRKEWMVQLRCLADDIEDCIDNFHVRKKTNSSKRQFARQVAQLKDRSKEIRKEFATIGDRTTASSEEVPPPAASYRRMRDAEAELVGLVQSQSEEGKLKVIAIAGLGGSGMTLLAKQVYESDAGLQFSHRAWVSAAGKNAEEILSEVLKKFQIQNNGASTSSQVEDKGKDDVALIQACLNNKRYLIVIDDVKKNDLKELVSVFSWADGVEGCRILATTTIQLPGVPTRCTCGDRSPLALDSTAHFLKIGLLTESRFEQDCHELGAKLKAVVVSDYESLCNLLLQDSLLYFCMFPSDHPVRRNPLIRRWSAEGLLLANPEDLIDQQDGGAADNLKTLIECNIIQPVVVSSNGKVKTCQPPLMMLDYIAKQVHAQAFRHLVLWSDSDQ